MNDFLLRKVKVALFLLVIHQHPSIAQENSNYPTYDFKSPLEIPLYLAGNFGELRSNHFHAGIDIKTQGVEGQRVLAAADGYVSRIKVSPYGYGLALYIRHPNGYTTVYGHLKKYNDEIAAYVKRKQYEKQTFGIELFPQASTFPLKQGDLIGISGNSGGSYAPHLHFEIRETAGEVPVNPLLFNFDIKDNIPPVIQDIYIYPLGKESEVNGSRVKSHFDVYGSNGLYRLKNNAAISAYGEFGMGISLFDKLNEMHNHCGIYEIKLFRNNELVYYQKMEQIPFHEKRYINALTDYEEKMEHNKWIVRNYILPNNKLGVYEVQQNRGIVEVEPGKNAHFRYVVTDAYGNQSTLAFDVSGTEKSASGESILAQQTSKYFKYNQANSFESEDLLVYLPANVLYEDLAFQYSKEEKLPRSITPVYNIHNLYTPLHSYMALSIKVKDVPSNMKKYYMIVSIDTDGNIIPEGGYWKGEYLIVKTRSFGPYTVMVDSTPPKLTPINITSGSNMSRKWSIIVKAEDNLSGVYEYNAYIDDKWVLLEFDYKKKQLVHYFEDDLASGNHSFRIVVRDKVGNETAYTTYFIR